MDVQKETEAHESNLLKAQSEYAKALTIALKEFQALVISVLLSNGGFP
jgi:hypothetical protein